MKFVCDKCHTRYSISDEKVKGKVLKIRCKTCGNIIVVREQGAESAAAVGAEGRGPAPRTEVELPKAAVGGGGGGGRPVSQAPANVEWFVAIKGKQHGPMRKDQIIQLFREQKIHDRSYCWNEGLAGWTRLRELPDFADAVAQGPGVPHALPPPPPDDEAGAEVVDLQAHRQQRAGHDPGMGMGQSPMHLGPVTHDPFAAVGGSPVPQADSSAPRESTRVFIMNAGLHNRSKKHKTYAVAASIAAVTIVGLGVLDYMGVVRIPFLGDATLAIAAKLGDESAQKKRDRREVLAKWEDGEEVDPEMLCQLGGVCPEAAAGSKRRIRKNAQGGVEGIDLDDAFQTGGPGEGGNLRAGVGDGAAVDPFANNASEAQRIRDAFSGDGRGFAKTDVKDKKQDERASIAVGGGGPDPASMQQVVGQNMESIKICVERAAKDGSTVGGKQKLLLTIQPNGRVKRSRILNGPVNAAPVGECINKSARKWKFPPFVGDEFELEIPLVLSTNL